MILVTIDSVVVTAPAQPAGSSDDVVDRRWWNRDSTEGLPEALPHREPVLPSARPLFVRPLLGTADNPEPSPSHKADGPRFGTRTWIGRVALTAIVASTSMGCATISRTADQAEGGRAAPTSRSSFEPTGEGPSDRWRYLPRSPLEGRIDPSAIWTGEELLVWGGQAAGGQRQFADGAAYDPANRSWRLLAGSPLEARDLHATVWTAQQMLVWGGLIRSNGADYDDGAAYDPETDSWRSLLASPIGPRSSMSAVWTGEEMIVWGGTGDDFLADGAAYDPSTSMWRMLEPSPLSGRLGAAAVWTGEEMVVFGGCSNAGTFDDGAAYDPIARKWRSLPASPGPPRCFPAHVWTGQSMLVWGGVNDGGGSTVNGVIYDPATDTWTETSAAPLDAAGADYLLIEWTGREILIWEGPNGAAYHPVSDQWRELPALDGRSFSVAAWTGEVVLLWGTEAHGGSDGIAMPVA
jgi:hypothetical protein